MPIIVIAVLAVIIGFGIVPDSFAQNMEVTLDDTHYEKMDTIINPASSPTPLIKLNDDKFQITKKTCVWCEESDTYEDTISIANLGDKDLRPELQILKLTQISSGVISPAPEEFTPTLRFRGNYNIEAGDVDNEIKLSMEIPFDTTSSYVGKVWFTGEGIEPFSTDIEVKVIPDNGAVVVYVTIGLVSGFIFGLVETAMRNSPTLPTFSVKGAITGSVKDPLDLKLEGKVTKSPEKKSNPTWTEKLWSNDEERTNYIVSRITLGGLAIVTSFPVVVFGNIYFSGFPWVDMIIACGIGFFAYRAQDLKKLYRGDKAS